MAADPCQRRNPLVRSGLTQAGRRRAELARDHFLPDERDLADLVLFGQRFAKHVQYYDAANGKAGDWSAFFESDVTASLAALTKLPLESFRTFQVDLENWLKADPARDAAALAAHFKLAFHLPVALLEIAGAHHGRLPNDHALRQVIERLLGRDLAEPLDGLIAWYKGAIDIDGAGDKLFDDTALADADYNLAGSPGDPRVRLSSTVADAVTGRPAFSAAPVPDAILSRVPPGTWAGLYAATAKDAAPYLDATGTYERIYDALSYNLMATAVEHVYGGIERIRRDAAGYLTESLESFGSHAPHYGLWLAFLQLFARARGELNKFTGRHLDFYFREVLRLGARAAVPDRAHLLFELAKGREAHLLPAGTPFHAGKDALSNPVSYALENDIVVNRGSVAELRGTRIETVDTAGKPGEVALAAPVVRSLDGLGEAELPETDPAFPVFGPDASPAARVGFAVADRRLFLREGHRKIIIRAELAAAISDTTVQPGWTVRLTGDEGWFEVPAAQVSTLLRNDFQEIVGGGQPDTKPTFGGGGRAAVSDAKKMAMKQAGAGAGKKGRAGGKATAGKGAEAGGSIIVKGGKGGREDGVIVSTRTIRMMQITVTLGPDDPPVVPLDAKLHGSEHAPGVPVAEIMFDFDDDKTPRAFRVLRDIRAEAVTVRAEATGVRNLMVIGGGAVADVAKPFPPFGPRPKAGAPFVIGSSEIFSKPIEAWRLQVDWQAAYGSGSYFRNASAADYNPLEHVLSGGKWLPASGEANIHLGEVGATIELLGAPLIDALTEQTIDNPPLAADTVNGFMRMRLPDDFGHEAYPAELARAMVDIAGGQAYGKGSGVNTYDSDPGTATATLPRLPYDPVLTRLEVDYETVRGHVAGFRLLHPFGISNGTADGRVFPELPFAGALHVGVADLKTPARLTLLMQVADGSGDPLIPAPDLAFHYLAGDGWEALREQEVDDKTSNLTGSGVLGLNLPVAADRSHRVMPDGLHWVRIAAPKDAQALNLLLSVDAQAARVAFADARNDPEFLKTPLPAGTIAKLVVPDLAIKKVTQPYSSFGGRPVEPADAFATRVSERLRHKDRALTMWDYEALVLEAFPTLYRVKCLSTTELKRNAENVIVADNELMPGAVTVVTVPWTRGQKARDPLRPYADGATMTAVEAFLRKRVSPFVRLEVQNPKFEEVHLDFKVRFGPEIGDIAFYMDELNQALVGFLTPWAREEGGEITFGGKLWKSTVIDFVEEWPHVDFVTDFRLYHKVDIDAGPGQWTAIDVEVIEATTARSILVSAARHEIHEVPADA